MRNEYSVGCTRVHIRKQNERYIVLIPLLIEIGDFVNRDKARNAFLTQGFLPSDAAKIVQGKQEAKFI